MLKDRNGYRYTIGLIAVIGGLGGLAGLYVYEVPEGNREALLLALGLVLGWGGSVINGEWGSSPAGREAAKLGIATANGAQNGPELPPARQPADNPDA